MSSILQQDRHESDQVSLAELWAVIWAGRVTVILGTLALAAIATVIAFTMTPQFESTVLLSPVSDEEGGSRFSGASALLSQFGGLSAIGGINLSGSNRKSEAIATLQSRALTETYIQEKNLLPILFENQWDGVSKRWRSDDPTKQPTLWQGAEFFRKVAQITDDKKTGLVKLAVTWKNPVLAATWANELVQRTNSYMRQKSIDQSSRNISYLNEQLSRTSVVELQRAIYSLIESEIKKVMISQGSDEYAFKVVDPAAVPERKSKPKRALIIIVGAAFGFLLAACVVLIRAKSRSTFHLTYLRSTNVHR